MRTLAIGDIHGCLNALTNLLDFIAPAPDDQLVTLGDYVDRGPNSRGVLEMLIDLHAKGRLVALRGNHEEMMLESRTNDDTRAMWQLCGGRAGTLARPTKRVATRGDGEFRRCTLRPLALHGKNLRQLV